MQQWQEFVKSRSAGAKMLTDSSTIANDHQRLLTPRQPAHPSYHARLSSRYTAYSTPFAALPTTHNRSLPAPRKYLVALTSRALTSIQNLARPCRRLTAMRSLFFWAIDAFEKSGSTI